MATVRVTIGDENYDYPDATYAQEGPVQPPGEVQPPLRVLNEAGDRLIAGYAAGSYDGVGFLPEPKVVKKAERAAATKPDPVSAAQ